jgi:hypothetical protein
VEKADFRDPGRGYGGDIWAPVWTPDGRILAQGVLVRSAMWRFRKEKP